MAPPNNPLVAKVALIMGRDTRQIVNTFHCLKPGGWSASDLVSLANLVKTWWDSYYKVMIPTNYALTQIQVRVYNPTVPLAYDLNVSPPIAGTRPGNAEPGNATMSMSERTGLAGRKYRGRMYLAGLAQPDVTQSDTVISFITAAAANAMANLISQLFLNNTELSIFHRNSNTVTEVIAYVIENILDSQRRRLPGRGR
jgi:hypothetical protein